MEIGMKYKLFAVQSCICFSINISKNSLKIPKGSWESVNRRRTDNTIAKRKRTNNDLQNITHKTKDRLTRTPLKPGGEFRRFGSVSIYCSTSGTRRVNLI